MSVAQEPDNLLKTINFYLIRKRLTDGPENMMNKTGDKNSMKPYKQGGNHSPCFREQIARVLQDRSCGHKRTCKLFCGASCSVPVLQYSCFPKHRTASNQNFKSFLQTLEGDSRGKKTTQIVFFPDTESTLSDL